MLSFTSCFRTNCPKIEGINVSELLYFAAENRSYPLCDLVEKSVAKDKEALKALSLLNIYDAASYDHGILLVDMIKKVGSSVYIDALGELSKEEKEKIKMYLDVGVEYGKKYSKYNGVEELFPEVAVFLKE